MPGTEEIGTSSTPSDEARFYYADGKKIPLSPSRRYVTVQSTGNGPAATRGGGGNGATRGRAAGADDPATATDMIGGLPASVVPGGQVFDLPELNLSVIEVPDAGPTLSSLRGGGGSVPGGGTENVRSFVSAQPNLQIGPSVYEAQSSATREGLIPTGEILAKFKPDVAEDARRRLLDRLGLQIRQSDYPEPGACLLVLSAGDRDPLDAANALHESDLTEYAQPNFARLMPRVAPPDGAMGAAGGMGVMPPPDDQMISPAPTPLPGAMRSAPAAPEAELLAAAAAAAAPAPMAPPTDPGFVSQWGLKKIKAPGAFDISMGSPSITIAVIDEGCDIAHEDIAYKLPGYDATDGDDNQQPKPADGHGTSCAGVAAARANNGKGGCGVAPHCKVLPVRIAYGAGGGWVTTDARIADGVRKAVDRGADVLSNSWGGGAPSTFITNAFKYAQTNGRGGRGCPTAIATANSDLPVVAYPANLSPTIPGLMAVGASNEWDQRKSKTSLDGENWWGSNYGPEVDVVAPGVHIYTTDITGAAGYGAANYIPNFNGTSSATPHVAGLMGLILSVDPDLRSWEVEEIIKMTADNLLAPGRDNETGFGRINCRRALEAASRIWYAVTAVPEFIGAGRECFLRMSVRIFNPGINTIRLDSLTINSHGPGGAVIDKLEYKATPGGVMAPRSDNDVRLNNVLLKANGTHTGGWSTSWSLGWGYTFWRPSAPVFPLAPDGPALFSEGEGRTGTGTAKGGEQQAAKPAPPAAGGQIVFSPGNQAAMNGVSQPLQTSDTGDGANGDTITIDRQSKSITIVIR